MEKPKQYIFEEWDSMCAKANKALHSDCPLLEDEVLVEMHKYVGAILIENEKLKKRIEDAEYLIGAFDRGADSNEYAADIADFIHT